MSKEKLFVDAGEVRRVRDEMGKWDKDDSISGLTNNIFRWQFALTALLVTATPLAPDPRYDGLRADVERVKGNIEFANEMESMSAPKIDQRIFKLFTKWHDYLTAALDAAPVVASERDTKPAVASEPGDGLLQAERVQRLGDMGMHHEAKILAGQTGAIVCCTGCCAKLYDGLSPIYCQECKDEPPPTEPPEWRCELCHSAYCEADRMQICRLCFDTTVEYLAAPPTEPTVLVRVVEEALDISPYENPDSYQRGYNHALNVVRERFRTLYAPYRKPPPDAPADEQKLTYDYDSVRNYKPTAGEPCKRCGGEETIICPKCKGKDTGECDMCSCLGVITCPDCAAGEPERKHGEKAAVIVEPANEILDTKLTPAPPTPTVAQRAAYIGHLAHVIAKQSEASVHRAADMVLAQEIMNGERDCQVAAWLAKRDGGKGVE